MFTKTTKPCLRLYFHMQRYEIKFSWTHTQIIHVKAQKPGAHLFHSALRAVELQELVKGLGAGLELPLHSLAENLVKSFAFLDSVTLCIRYLL